MAVIGFQADATAAMRAENMFNPRPAAGGTYSLVRLRATYRGSGDGNAAVALNAGFVGADNRKYSAIDCIAVEPDSLSDQPNVFPGGTVEGNECLMLPIPQIPTGELFVEETFAFDGRRVWWRTA